jgi:hypothetical protein
MTEPNPPSSEPNATNPWARPPEGAPEPPVSYAPPQPQQPHPTANWAYQPHQPTSAPPQQQPPRSLTPIIAIIVAAVILLCVGTAVAGKLVFDQARDAVSPTPGPTRVAPTTGAPTGRPDPTGAPPTDNPFPLPTGLPGLPEDLLPSGVAVQAKPDSTVVYEVTGDGSAAITFTEAGRPRAEGTTQLPWRKEFTIGTETPLLNVVGIHFGTSSSELTCRILLDGKEIVKRTATGNATTASCAQIVVVS